MTLDWIENILGTKFSGESFTVALIFLFIGYFYGKLTVRIGWLKFIAAFLVGAFLYQYLRNAAFFFSGSFILGVCLNHLHAVSEIRWRIQDMIDDFRFSKLSREIFDVEAREEAVSERESKIREREENLSRAERDFSTKQKREQSNAARPKQKAKPASKYDSHNNEKKLNPKILSEAYEILGVPIGASLDECKKARTTLLTMYHPDKVAHLNETRRKLAEQETKRINASWERIKRK